MKKTLKTLLLLCLAITIISCRQQNRVADFIKQYNEIGRSASFSSTQLNGGFISHSIAELVDREDNKLQKDIQITLFTNRKQDDEEILLLKEIIPASFVSFIQQNPLATEILDRGVRFKVIFSTRNGRPISELIIDKAKYQELILSKNSNETNNSFSNPEVTQLLAIINKQLPKVVSKELNARLTEISVNNEQRLTYKIIIGNPYSKSLMGARSAALLKEEMLRSPNLTSFFGKMRFYGIKGITCIYYNEKGEEINKLDINKDDL